MNRIPPPADIRSRKQLALASLAAAAVIVINTVWYIRTRSLLPLSVAVLYTLMTAVWLYKARSLPLALVAALILPSLLALAPSPSTGHVSAAALPSPALPATATMPESNCWIATGSWIMVTTGLLISAPTGWGLMVGAWGEVVAINGVVTGCNDGSGGPAYWTLIWWSNSGGGGGSW